MLTTIAKLFGRSPFAPLQSHMESVAKCIRCLGELCQAMKDGNYPLLEKLAEEISKLEHDADLIKNDIRNHLPKSLFLPIDRGNLLEILSIQDRIADRAEDVAVVAGLKQLEVFPIFKDDFSLFVRKNIETFDLAQSIIKELPELVESSFGGSEAQRVRVMVDEVAFHEHEVDLIQRNLLKNLFKAESQLTFVTFHQWLRLIHGIGSISNLSENLAHRIRLTLELK